MKSSGSKNSIILFVLLMITSLAFVFTSVWLIYEVNVKRDRVEVLMSQIDIISALEVDLMDCLDLSYKEDEKAFQTAIEEVVNSEFHLEDYSELAQISENTLDLKKYFNVSGVLMKFEPFQNDLQSLYLYAVGEIKESRKELGQVSVDLSNYWNYTHVMVVLACLLSIFLAIIGLVVLTSRRKLKDLKVRNSLFMSSVADCVIVCDNIGLIVDFNEPAEQTFGYSMSEAVGMPITDFYATRNDWESVKDGLANNDFYKGEIVNKGRDNVQFVSFLSASVVRDDAGNRIGTMGISRDITKQKRNEEQFQHIVDNATDIIYTTNIQGEITYVNTSANSVLGYSSNDFIGMSFRELIHPDFLEHVEEHYNQQFKSRNSETYLEFKMVKANGDDIWIGQNVRASFSPIDPSQITGFFGILRNLDNIKKVEIELFKSEAKYRELFDNSKDLIQSIDAYGKILYVNESWKNALGYQDEELKELSLFDIIDVESRDYCEELLTQILKDGDYDGEQDHLFHMKTKSGKSIILKGTLSVRYKDGQVESLQTFLRDVTEHHKIEQALLHSEENFRRISNSINDVFFLYNSVLDKYEYISPNCSSVLGVEPEFFYEGKNYAAEFLHQEDAIAVAEMNAAVRSGSPGQLEYRRVLGDEIRWIEEEWFPIKGEAGEIVSISGICRDVTAMKEAYNIIYEQNKEISQSILYAKNIQESTLPTAEEITAILPESFVFYKAKDILSGDLYIVDKILTNDGESWPAFIVGDCTGHGVPGSLLSLLCNGLLTESLTNHKVNSPAQALDLVREKLIRLFRSNKAKYILDGMDAAFCVLNKEKKELYFAGANLSCYIVRDGEVLEYKGDKQHIGYSSTMHDFIHFAIDIEDGDAIYLTTDGYVDQFGGIKNKKFLRKRFTALLLEIEQLPMAEQGIKVEERFLEWKGDNPQTDDIVMLGVKL